MVGHHHNNKNAANINNGMNIKLLRGGTDLVLATNLGFTGAISQNQFAITFVYLDSPATTSATTYKTQFNSNTNTANVTVQHDNDLSSIVLMEIGA